MTKPDRRWNRPVAGGRVGCVIDVETVPDPDAVALAPTGASAGPSRRLLHRVVCATILSFSEDVEHGRLAVLGMRTLSLERLEEGVMLGRIDGLLPDPTDPSSTLVTFNGAASDMMILRQRAMRLWMFDMPRLRGWAERRENHRDMMYAFGTRPPHPSLAEVSALIGTDLKGTRSSDPATRWIERGDWAPIERRNRSDVCATFLAYAYWSAWRRGCELPVATAWTALAGHIGAMGDRGHDLREFHRHHMVGFAARRVAELDAVAACACGTAAAA